MTTWEVPLRGDAPDGQALRRQFDTLCDQTADLVGQARGAARTAGDPAAERFFARQVSAIASLKSIADGRRYLPGMGTGLLHDIPPEAAEPPYREAMDALSWLASLWAEGLHVPGWDWQSKGYPPGWNVSLSDRLRAGVFYRQR